jgi:hypothetical protein
MNSEIGWFRSTLVIAAFAAGLIVIAPSARADDDCQKRVIHADHELHKAIDKHGPNSPDADKWRAELASARSYCWDHEHKWWDEDGHRWHTEKDWDDHDHDHPH